MLHSEMRAPKKVALFDVDKTLVDGYSGYYTTLRLMRCGAIRKRRIAKAIFYKAVSTIYHGDVRKMYELVLGDMAGWPLERVLEIGSECFTEDIKPRLYRGAIELVKSHQDKGHNSYFVTAAPYMTVKVLGDYLGVNADYAPAPEIRDGVLQSTVKEPLAYGDGKLDVARLIAEQEKVSLADCYFYSDNIDDIVLLEAVGHPHAVNPDKKLLRVAEKKGWPILHYKECLG